MTDLKRTLAALLIPKYSERLDQANWYARLRSWQAENLSDVPVLHDRAACYEYINRAFVAGKPMDYLEFGVYRGQSLRDWMALNVHPRSRFWGFDSFSGLPDGWIPGFGEGSFSLEGLPPKIPDDRATLVRGLFQDTLPKFLKGFKATSQLVVNLDCDLYSSTLYCLCTIDPLLIPGSIIIFDEFPNPIHEFRAFLDYCGSYRRRLQAIALGGADFVQCAFRVP